MSFETLILISVAFLKIGNVLGNKSGSNEVFNCDVKNAALCADFPTVRN